MNSFERMREKEKLLTYEQVKEIFDCDPEKGILIWKNHGRDSYLNGTVAGWFDKSTGYVQVYTNKTTYKSHRVMWLLVTGKWPENQIDHINGIRNDNRFCNLREATHSQNRANSSIRPNFSGYRGVRASGKKWRAEIRFNNKTISLGTYDTPEEAHAAYVAKAKELFGDYTKV
jgi:hypothetical protein